MREFPFPQSNAKRIIDSYRESLIMPFDGFVLAAIRKELAEKIEGAQIDRVYQPRAHALVLNLRRGKERERLLLSAHPVNARVHLLSTPVKNPPAPPTFCMVLRKHIEGGYVQKVTQLGLDRVLILEIETRNEIGSFSQENLVCEIMGKYSNIILVKRETGQIIDAIKRYSHAVSRHREVLPGRPYVLPPAQDKLNSLFVRQEDFEAAILGRPLETPLENVLQACLDGFSTILAREVVYRANLASETVLDECGDYELARLWQSLQQLTADAKKDRFEPTLVGNQNKYIDFAAFDLTHLTGLIHQKGEMNTLVDDFYAQQENREKLEKERNILLKCTAKELKRLRKKFALQKEQLNRTKEANEYRLCGELLIANLHQIEKGLPEVTLENYFDPAGSPVRITLDPRFSPVENARLYFKKYNKAKLTLEKSKHLVEESQKEIDYLTSVETTLQQAASLDDLLEIKMELVEEKYITRDSQKKLKKQAHRPPELLSFTSSDGFTILVGKNNKQNDYLTLRLAGENDLWLHAQKMPGAHVILRLENRQPTPNAIREAACLAAYFSQARHSQNVPVDYTLRKNVSKPRGAKPGFVIYKEQRSLFANPDKKKVEHLSNLPHSS